MALRLLHPSIEFGVPLVFLCVAFVPSEVSFELSYVSLFLLAALGADLCFHSKWIAAMIRVVLYLILPMIIYQCIQQTAAWFVPFALKLFIISLVVLALLTILMLRMTRRRKGFRPTPTDYLIVLIAVVLANFPQPSFAADKVSFWGTCFLVFFFSVEVLLGELRDNVRRGGLLFLPSLFVLVVRGLNPF